MESTRALDNPFRPGAGRVPPVLAGRGALLGTIQAIMRQTVDDGVGDRPFVLWGLRGVGKTAVLRAIADNARREGWIVIALEAMSDESLAQRIAQVASLEFRRYRGAAGKLSAGFKRALSVFRSFQLQVDPTGMWSFGVEVNPASGYADTGDFSLDLQDMLTALGEAARDDGIAVLLAIDELQEAPLRDLAALNAALHALGQEVDPVPVVFLGAGLPSLPGVLADAKSYAERLYRYFTIGLLSDEEAAEALERPALDKGVMWDEGALALAVEASRGYPYLVQQCGSCAWEQRAANDRISEEDCRVGVLLAQDEVDRGLYRSRWERASQQERGMMMAMAQDIGPSTVADVAQRLGKTPSGISRVRSRLIDAGQIYTPERGKVAFVLPGMEDYIRRRTGIA